MAATRLRIFVSSVQKEFAKVRSDLKAFLLGDAALRRFVSDVFIFEDLPAADRRADDVYLDEVGRADIYLGIFGLAKGATKGPKGPGARSERDTRTGRSQGPQRGQSGQSAKPRSKGRRES